VSTYKIAVQSNKKARRGNACGRHLGTDSHAGNSGVEPLTVTVTLGPTAHTFGLDWTGAYWAGYLTISGATYMCYLYDQEGSVYAGGPGQQHVVVVCPDNQYILFLRTSTAHVQGDYPVTNVVDFLGTMPYWLSHETLATVAG